MLNRSMNLHSTRSSHNSRKIHASCATPTRGMTLVELTCVTVVMSILVLMILPATAHHKSGGRRVKCINNLKNIGLAFRIYSTDNNDLFPFQVSTNRGGTSELVNDVAAQFRILSNELSTPKILICPRDYPRLNEATNWQSLSAKHLNYLVGMDASETNASSILGGDDGFLVNGGKTKPGLNKLTATNTVIYPKKFHIDRDGANLVFGDGRVETIGAKDLPKKIAASGAPTNHFVLP
jgi:prepilin-type N-terminal cleavage/methylation domain-containing protein